MGANTRKSAQMRFHADEMMKNLNANEEGMVSE